MSNPIQTMTREVLREAGPLTVDQVLAPLAGWSLCPSSVPCTSLTSGTGCATISRWGGSSLFPPGGSSRG